MLVAGLVGLLLAPAAAPAAAAPGWSADEVMACGGDRPGAPGPTGEPGNLTLETFVAPGASYDRLTSPAALRAARQNGSLNPASVGVDRSYEDEVVAYRDVIVHRVALNGSAAALVDRLAGANASSPTERFRSFLANGTLGLEYHGPSACPPELAVNASLDAGAIRVVPAPADDTVAFILDTDRLRFHPLDGGEPTTDTLVFGHHSFAIAMPAGGLTEARARVENGYTVEPAAAELDSRHEGLVRVEPAADQLLEGRTTFAPGSEITVRMVPYVGADGAVVARATVDRSRRFAVSVDLGTVPDGTIYAAGFESITRPPVVRAGATFVAVGKAAGAIVDARNQSSTGDIVYGPTLTTTHGGFVTVRNATGALVGVSEYHEPGRAVAQIELDRPLARSQRVTVTVYRDVNGDRTFDIDDVPYRVGGEPVRDTARVQLKRDEPVTVDPMPTRSPDTPTTTPDPSPTTTPGQPGFSLVAALVAGLLAIGLRARRRG